MAKPIKDFQSLTLADDFMFGEIMRQVRFCKPFLEALLDTKIADIHVVDKQKDLTDEYNYHGIRLDVYIEDDNGTKYDIEMQTTTQKELPKRIRYYQSGIDRRMLKRSNDYDKLHESYIIFICLSDYFDRGLAKYERVSCIKDAPDIVYDDGTHAIILNADFSVGNAAPDILEFLAYIKARRNKLPFDTEHSTYLTEVDEAIREVKQDGGKEKVYMTIAMKLRDTYNEGVEQGKRRGIANIVANMLSLHKSPEDICTLTGQPKAVIDAIIAEITNK